LTRSEQPRVAAGIELLKRFGALRNAILLLGGNKISDPRWYEVNVPIADRLYDEQLIELKKERIL